MNEFLELFIKFSKFSIKSTLHPNLILFYEYSKCFSYHVVEFYISDSDTPKIPEIFHIRQRIDAADSVTDTAMALFKVVSSLYPFFNIQCLE